MKIGLPFLTQLRGVSPDDPTTRPSADALVTTDESGQRNTTGGWTALTFQQMVAGILAGYHTQHNDDDTHSTITASGAISERNRTTAQGVWIDMAFSPSAFTAASGTWVVKGSQVATWAYYLVGTTMTVAFQITGSQQALATTTKLRLALPALVVRSVTGTCAYDDNGTRGTGVVTVSPGSGNLLVVQKDVAAAGTFSVSSNLSIAGQLSIDVTGV